MVESYLQGWVDQHNIPTGHRSHAYGRGQMSPTRNDAMQQVAFECQKLIWAGLHQPAPRSQWPLRILIQDKGGAPWLCQKQHRADQLQGWKEVVRLQWPHNNAGGNAKLTEAYVNMARWKRLHLLTYDLLYPLWVTEYLLFRPLETRPYTTRAACPLHIQQTDTQVDIVWHWCCHNEQGLRGTFSMKGTEYLNKERVHSSLYVYKTNVMMGGPTGVPFLTGSNTAPADDSAKRFVT